jgi:predicted kinase
LFLTTDLATRQRRIGQRAADASDATAKIAEFQENYDIGRLGWATIDTSGTPAQTLDQCRLRISMPQYPQPPSSAR